MPTSRHTPEQIADALHRARAGANVTRLFKGLGIARHMFYNWRKKFEPSGLAPPPESQAESNASPDRALALHAPADGPGNR